MLDGGLVRAQSMLFLALADDTRLQILHALQKGERNVTELSSGIGREQSAISHHLRCLRNCGLVRTRKEGRETYYSLNGKGRIQQLLQAARSHVEETLNDVLSCDVLPEETGRKVAAR